VPDLNFRIAGVDQGVRGLTPLLHFQLEVSNSPATESIHTVMLQAQIQIQSPQRIYNAQEKEKLEDLFGTPDRWGQTLRNKLWTHANTCIRTFSGKTEALLPVPCTYDLNVSATKYFYALEDGEVPLIFLFSGTVFYASEAGHLQVQQIPWDNECTYRMPVHVWKALMDHHYPGTAWLSLDRELFDRLYAYRRRRGLATWDQAIEQLLPAAENLDVAP
jgi:Family of unknown function (DUF6084)